MGLLFFFFREKYIFSYENNNHIYYKGERIMSKKSIILTVAGICCGVIIGVDGCKLYEKLTDNQQTYTDMEIAESFAYDKYGDDKSEIVLRNYDYENDMLDFYIYRDGDIKAASGVNRTYWSNKLADGYVYEK